MPVELSSLAVPPVVLAIANSGNDILALRILAIAAIAAGIAAFVTHGGSRVSAAGVYCITAGIMVGCGAWYWAGQVPPATTRGSILEAGLVIYASTAAMYLLFWRRSMRSGAVAHVVRPPISLGEATSLRFVGTILFLVGATLNRTGPALGGLTICAAEVGVIMFASSLLLSGGIKALQTPVRTCLAGGVFIVYYLVVFSGYGRLRLATLVIATVVLAQYRLRTRVKPIAVLTVLPTLALFATIGQQRLASATNNTVQASASGLGSLVNPLATVGQLLHEHLTGGGGSTLLAEVIVIVPRQLWPHKPLQFGRVLALDLHPETITTKLSMPCMPQGEWYYNFGWFGLILMIPVLGWAVRWLDNRLERRIGKPLISQRDVYSFVGLAILVGSISDLAWGGTATWTDRNIQRLLLLLPFVLVTYFLSKRRAAHAPIAATPGLTAPTRTSPAQPVEAPAPKAPAAPATMHALGVDSPAWPDSLFDPGPNGWDAFHPVPGGGLAAHALRGARGRAIAAFTDEALSSLQNFVVLFLALHYLSVSHVGEFTLAYTGAFLVKVILKSLILAPLSINFSAAARAAQRRAGAQALGACLVIGTIAFAITAASSLAVHGQSRSVVLASAVVLPALIVQEGWRVYFFAVARPWRAVFNDGACLVATLLLAYVLVLRPHAASTALLLLLWAAGTGVGVVVGVAQARLLPAVHQAWAWTREHWSLGSRIAAGNSAQQVAGRISLALIGAIAGTVALGRLAASRTLMTPGTTVQSSAVSFGVPEASRLYRNGDPRLRRFIPGLSIVLGLAVTLLGLLIYLVPDHAGRLVVGQNWFVAKSLLLPVIIWNVANCVQQGPMVALLVRRRSGSILRLSLVTGALVLVGAVAGSYAAGASGAAWGLAIAQVAATIPFWVAYRRLDLLGEDTSDTGDTGDLVLAPVAQPVPEPVS
ncbi:MAG: hypothetical protein ACR2LF_11255 [Jatrophihabitantaceae bacterium]